MHGNLDPGYAEVLQGSFTWGHRGAASKAFNRKAVEEWGRYMPCHLQEGCDAAAGRRALPTPAVFRPPARSSCAKCPLPAYQHTTA